MIRLKHLESCLQMVNGFKTPKINLEQYETPPHIAARMLYTIESSFGELSGNYVADLGCGCGMLSIGACLMGAHACGFDIDADAVEICKENIEELETNNVEVIQADALALSQNNSRWHKAFDAVILNPPFGTKKNHGTDMLFLKTALDLSSSSVYSLHKSTTRSHIVRTASNWGVKVEVLAALHYNLPNTYRFHKKSSVDIEVDFIRFSHKSSL